MSEVVAVIPARGGSKGVPGKNLREVGGVPLVVRSVMAARASGAVDRVVVSTDDPAIAAAGDAAGAEIVDRPAEISGDTASSESALLHALDVLAGRGVSVGVLAFLQATSPFVDPALLASAVRRVAAGEADAVFAAVPFHGFLWDVGGGVVRASGHDAARRPRRQDRAPQVLETGAFYVLDAAGFRAAGHRFFGRLGVELVAEADALEIDTEEQLRLADALAAARPAVGPSDPALRHPGPALAPSDPAVRHPGPAAGPPVPSLEHSGRPA